MSLNTRIVRKKPVNLYFVLEEEYYYFSYSIMYQTFKRFLTVIAVMLVGISAFAQVTTSSLNGKVTDTTGEPVVGAAVIAVHNPSGTQYYAVANLLVCLASCYAFSWCCRKPHHLS